MSLTSLIRSNEASFKLAQRLVDELSTKFNFSKEDGWSHVCTMSVEAVAKKQRRDRKRADPLRKIKKPRTAFSFFTQSQRPLIQGKNPTAKFGELSRLVSQEWKSLSEAQMKDYKEKEATDRARYTQESAALRAQLSVATPVPVATATPSADSTQTTPAKSAKTGSTPKAPKVPKATATQAAVPAVAPVASTPSEAKPAKKAKSATSAATATVPTAPATAPATASAPTPAASTDKKERKSAKNSAKSASTSA